MANSQRPPVSIVIGSFGTARHLERCLFSMEDQVKKHAAQVIVATTLGPADTANLERRFGGVYLHSPDLADRQGDPPIPETRLFRLRSCGLREATGEFVVFVEDHCEVEPTWLDGHLAAHQDGPAIGGGYIENGNQGDAYCWALYWAEYAALLPPVPFEEVGYISAANASYRLDSLKQFESIWREAFYDNEVHDALIAHGHQLVFRDDAGVRSSLPFSFRGAMVHLFTGGRRYGPYGVRDADLPKKALRLGATPVIPAVMLSRVFRSAARRRASSLPMTVASLPWLVAFLSAWGYGEGMGVIDSLTGKGDSPWSRPDR